jgi:glutamate-1-semialdehyde-2,1-aminomutase
MSNVRAEIERKTPGSKQAHERSLEVLGQLAVGTLNMPYPIYIRESKGSHVTDVDGNEYVDLALGFGPHILGHAPDVVVDAVKEAAERGFQWALHNPYQEQLARLIVEAVPCADRVEFCNTGTEATMFAIRAARAYSRKDRIAMFDGGYHGAHDVVMVKAAPESPRDAPTFNPFGDGIPKSTLQNVIMLPYRSPKAFDMIRKHKDELALVLIEPVQSSNPRLDHVEWLRELCEVCKKSGVLFLMDEIITGFRLAYGGAQELFDITPDLATYGKVIGGGMPVGAIAGRADIMDVYSRGAAALTAAPGSSPRLPGIFAAGTFGGNPISMVAGTAALTYLKAHPESYKYLAEHSMRLAGEVNRFCQTEEIPAQLMSALSMFFMRIQRGGPIQSARDIDPSLKKADEAFFMHLLNNGVVIPGIHQFHISTAHTPEDIDFVIEAMKRSFLEVRKEGLL